MDEMNENLEKENTENPEKNSTNDSTEEILTEEENTDRILNADENSKEDAIEIEKQDIKGKSIEDSDDLLSEKTPVGDSGNELMESEEEEKARLARQVRDFHRNLIEAALYAAGKPLSIEVLSTKLEFGKKEVEELVNELAFDYLDRSTALVIAQMGDRYQMQIKPEYTEKISKFAEGGAIAERYLRTLTIIALKQPILKSLVIKLRGSGAYEHIKYLLENDFINAVKKGRSQELTTSEKYAEMFGLPKDINEMKRVMVAQLGLEEGSSDEQLSEPEGDLISEELNDTNEISETEEFEEPEEEE